MDTIPHRPQDPANLRKKAMPLIYHHATLCHFPELEKPAPTFRLNNHEAELARVGGPQKHWSVLAFFPKAMTPG